MEAQGAPGDRAASDLPLVASSAAEQAAVTKLWLFNCPRCDDVHRIVERPRTCECGKVTALLDVNGTPVLTGKGRIWLIPWEEYDGAAPGETRRWMVAKEQGETEDELGG